MRLSRLSNIRNGHNCLILPNPFLLFRDSQLACVSQPPLQLHLLHPRYGDNGMWGGVAPSISDQPWKSCTELPMILKVEELPSVSLWQNKGESFDSGSQIKTQSAGYNLLACPKDPCLPARAHAQRAHNLTKQQPQLRTNGSDHMSLWGALNTEAVTRCQSSVREGGTARCEPPNCRCSTATCQPESSARRGRSQLLLC